MSNAQCCLFVFCAEISGLRRESDRRLTKIGKTRLSTVPCVIANIVSSMLFSLVLQQEIAQFSAAENVEGLVQATRIRNMQGSFDIPRLSKRSFAAWGSLSQPPGGLSSPTTGVAMTGVTEEYPVNYNHYPSFGQQHSYSTSDGTTVSPLSQPTQPSQTSRPQGDSLSDNTV
jgi:hypothetical protein